MKNIHILLILLLCLSNIINVYNSTLKQKSNQSSTKNKANNEFRKRSNKKIFSKRKAQDEIDPGTGGGLNPGLVPPVDLPEDLEQPTYKRLKILIDTEELFNSDSFPTELVGYKNIILEAMNKAKDYLEDFLEISVYSSAHFNKINDGYNVFADDYGISHCSPFFDDFDLNDYNYFIFGKFIGELRSDIDSASYILEKYNLVPYIGIVYFNQNIDESKLTLEYLTPLMLHQFIQLLGFSISSDSYDSFYRLTEVNYPNVIDYAQKYFGCNTIQSIILSIKTEGTYYFDCEGSSCSYTIRGLYWPKRILLGELLTRFDYPEERVLSGFTLAFLSDLPYLEVKKEYYTGGLMRFGKHKGCDFFFNSWQYYNYDSPIFANEFLLPPDDSLTSDFYPSCSSGRLSKTVYITTFRPGGGGGGKIGMRLRRQQDALDGGETYDQMGEDDIGLYAEFPNEENYHGSCFDSNTAINAKRSEVISSNSFCVLSSLEEGRNVNPTVLSICYEMKCSSKSLSIKVGDYYIVCPKEGGKIFAEHFNGFIMCPDYNLICTGSTMCNNLLDCINKKSTEKEASLIYDEYSDNGVDDDGDGEIDDKDEEPYRIKTTQNPGVYNKIYRDYGWELATDGVCPKFCMQCKSNTDCERCAPQYAFIDGQCVKDNNCETFGFDGYSDETNDDGTVVENENGDCIACKNGYFLTEVSSGTYCASNNNKDSYFLSNKALGIYKKCDSEISHCQKCSSKTKCDACLDGYELQENDGISICYKKEDDDDDGLSKGAIAGIVIGCVGCAALISFIILLLKRKKNEKDKISNSSKKIVETAKENVKDPLEDDIKVIEYDKKSENMDVTAKRMAPKDKNIY